MAGNPEARFGIKTHTRPGSKTLAQRYSILAGVFYVALGVIGFYRTGFGSGPDPMNQMLFGIFMVNPFHNTIHLVVGLLWLLGGFVLTAAGTEGLNLAIGTFWTLATVLGFLGYLSALAANSGATPDNFLHLGTALVTLVFGASLLRALSGSGRAATT
jgi:hypothetical protein